MITLYESLLKSFNWMNEDSMTEKETFDLLERKFYPFKEVNIFSKEISLEECLIF